MVPSPQPQPFPLMEEEEDEFHSIMDLSPEGPISPPGLAPLFSSPFNRMLFPLFSLKDKWI